MGKSTSIQSAASRVPFRIHPRVFQALGSELVTSDVVAIIELVKNSYDAFATRVDVRFREDDNGQAILEIEDNGDGMTNSVIRDAWFVVATPFRETHPQSKRGQRVRRTTGAKGLGRLSAARLGDRLSLITRASNREAWRIDVNWKVISNAPELDVCEAEVTPYSGAHLKEGPGTLISIQELRSGWGRTEIEDLKEALSRLTSPFEGISDFAIFFTPPGASAERTKIEPSEFLKAPPYLIKGTFLENGHLHFRYVFRPASGEGRSDSRSVEWAVIQKEMIDSLPRDERSAPRTRPLCGPFAFEIRAWDLDRDSLNEAEARFAIKRAMMRRQIRAFKGVSLYRDGVLVLPKSETNRDWLGLDLRRVSRVGGRLSTSQIVGYVSITADSNPGIEDTSDRERLARNAEVVEFERLLKYVVSCFEIERSRDQVEDEPTLRELFADVSPARLVDEIGEVSAEGGSAGDVLPLVNKFAVSAEKARAQIERQFVYYNRLATIGTITELLIHEVGNNCGAIDAFITCVKDWLAGSLADRSILDRRLALAKEAVQALQALADRFRPLASRGYTRGKRTASLRATIDACLAALAEPIKQSRVEIETDLKGKDELAIDPGELYPVFFNLLDNAIYWVHRSELGKRRIEIRATNRKSGVMIEISDSGPGVVKSDVTRIFRPGVTRRPHGSGMGLTVAAELVESNGGHLAVEPAGRLKGATFLVQLPSATKAR